MAKTFQKLTRKDIRKLSSGEVIIEHGITYEKLADGDGRYTVNIMVDGVRVHRVIGKESEGVTREKAEDYIAQARTDARTGRLNLPKARKTVLTLRKAAEQYLERMTQEGGKNLHAKSRELELHILPILGNKPLSQIATFDIERFKKDRKEYGLSEGSINRNLATISHIINKALEWRWINHKPCIIKKFKESTGRIVYLTPEQCARLLAEAKADQNPYVYPFIMIGLQTSMRMMEILSIRLEHIDLNRMLILIPKAKAGMREQPITKELATLLAHYIKDARPGQEWLFSSPSSRTGHTVAIERPYRRVVTAAGLDPKVIVRHTLRHTAITHLVQANVDLPTVQRVSGHKTLSMVVRYAHQNGAHIQEAMDKLESRYQIQTETSVA